MSLPSLRAESLRGELAAAIRQVRRTGFTIAPEAGTERLRRVINKPLTDDEILAAAEHAFGAGWEQLKLYFMIGLPTETHEDVLAIPELVKRVFQVGRRVTGRARVNVTVSVFAPKAHTPFEREPMPSPEEIAERLRLLPQGMARGAVTFRIARTRMVLLEAALARGDRRGGEAIEIAYRAGARFAGWSEHFDFARWEMSFAKAGLDLTDEATRARADDEALPWDGVDIGVSPGYLRAERDRARSGQITVDCRTGQCHDCGVCDHERIAIALADAAPALAPAASPLSPMEVASQVPRYRYWLRFAKTGPARWLSHLEMTKVFSRALRRGGLPVLYSGGFHPLPRLAFGPPLSAGVESRAEFADIALSRQLDEADVFARVARSLPDGLEAVAIQAMAENAPSLFEAIVAFEFRIDLARLPEVDDAPAQVARFLALAECPVSIERKGKRKTIDARPLVRSATAGGGALVFQMRHTHSEGSIRPAHLAALLLGLREEDVPPYVLTKIAADASGVGTT
jgi:radical SAM-linked protein